MVIDERKVNLAEADIEQWLWENPEEVQFLYYGTVERVQRWIGRQFDVPSGIIDLMGISTTGFVVVVEVKNTEIQPSALTQVSRYAFDVRNITEWAHHYASCERDCPQVVSVVIGKSIDDKTFKEAEALQIKIVTFLVKLTLDTKCGLEYSEEYREYRVNRWAEIAKQPAFESAVTYHEQYWQARIRALSESQEATASDTDSETLANNLATTDDLVLDN